MVENLSNFRIDKFHLADMTIFYYQNYFNYTQNKLVCINIFTQCIDFEYNEDIIFLKKNYRRYNLRMTNKEWQTTLN